MRKIKILYTVSTLERVGPTKQLFYILKNLDKDIFKPFVLTLSPEPENSLHNDFNNFNVISLNNSRIKGFLKNKKEIKKLVNNIKPDIIHSCGLRADRLNSILSDKYNTINTLRNYPFDDYKSKYGSFMGAIMARFHIKYIKKININIACSESIKNIFFNKEKIDSIPIQNGVDVELYKPISYQVKNKLRNDLGFKNEDRLFISVGSLISRKNPEYMIKEFKKMNKNNKLIILGEGPLKKQLENISSGHKNIIFLGNKKNVNNYLNISDFFISTSKAEGLPNSVLEAMSSGIPVILSNISPHMELIKNTEFEKMVFSFNENSLFNILNKVESFDKEALGILARRIVLEKFSDKIMSNKYQEIYKKIVIGAE
jgi:glycosyltransferase involved in cell wall biosynthesis